MFECYVLLFPKINNAPFQTDERKGRNRKRDRKHVKRKKERKKKSLFRLFVIDQWHIKLLRLFKAKSILLKKQ